MEEEKSINKNIFDIFNEASMSDVINSLIVKNTNENQNNVQSENNSSSLFNEKLETILEIEEEKPKPGKLYVDNLNSDETLSSNSSIHFDEVSKKTFINENKELKNFINTFIKNKKTESYDILMEIQYLLERISTNEKTLKKEQEDFIINSTDNFNKLKDKSIDDDIREYLYLNIIMRHQKLNDLILEDVIYSEIILPNFVFDSIILNKSIENSNYIYKLAIKQNIGLEYITKKINDDIYSKNNSNIEKLLNFFTEIDNLNKFINLFNNEVVEYSMSLNRNIYTKLAIMHYMKYNEQKRTDTQIFNIKNGNEHACIISDIHGDLLVLLNFLITSRIASFNESEYSFKYYNINTGKSSLNLQDLITESNDYSDIRIIPNLNCNKNFIGNCIINGDLIDRGYESEECFYTVLDLIENQNCQNLIYLIGNHELFLLQLNEVYEKRMMYATNIITKKIQTDGCVCTNLKVHDKHFFDKMSERLINIIENKGKYVKACHVVNDILVSHTSINKSILEGISSITNKKIDDIFNIEFFINNYYKIGINDNFKMIFVNELLLRNVRTAILNYSIEVINKNVFDIFWNRDYKEKTGLKQVIGHTFIDNYLINNDKKLFIDLCRSCAINGYGSKFDFVEFKNGEICSINCGCVEKGFIDNYFGINFNSDIFKIIPNNINNNKYTNKYFDLQSANNNMDVLISQTTPKCSTKINY